MAQNDNQVASCVVHGPGSQVWNIAHLIREVGALLGEVGALLRAVGTLLGEVGSYFT